MSRIQLPTVDTARDVVRQFNKRILNPVMLQLAGRRYWYAAAIHHQGRSSGRQYLTPIVADEIEGGFLIPLPYGTDVDWLRNVLVSGRAVLDVHGCTFEVGRPEILEPAQALPLLSGWRAAWWRAIRMGPFLRLMTEPATEPATAVAIPAEAETEAETEQAEAEPAPAAAVPAEAEPAPADAGPAPEPTAAPEPIEAETTGPAETTGSEATEARAEEARAEAVADVPSADSAMAEGVKA